MNYTSIKQSKYLLKLGLKPDTADMWYSLDEDDLGYSIVYVGNEFDWDQIDFNRALPCWSVGSLIDLLPETIPYVVDNQTTALVNLQKDRVAYVCYGWDNIIVFETGRGELIDCLVDTVEWLLQNKHI